MMCIWCETFINDYFIHYSFLTFSNSYKLLNIVNIAVDIIYKKIFKKILFYKKTSYYVKKIILCKKDLNNVKKILLCKKDFII